MATWILTQTADAQLILRPVIWEKKKKKINQYVLNWVGGPRESIGNRFFIVRLR